MSTPIADEFEAIRSRLRQIENEREAGQRYAGLSPEVRDELARLLRSGAGSFKVLDDWLPVLPGAPV